MLADVLPALRCPHCAAHPLRLDGASVTCPAGHAYDVARQGYVNLLPGGARPGTADTAEMVAARARFLGAGHYDVLADALADAVVDALTDARTGSQAGSDGAAGGSGDSAGTGDGGIAADRSDSTASGGLAGAGPLLLDLGSGPGTYLARCLDRLAAQPGVPGGPGLPDLPGARGLALDLSKHAVRRAARAHPRAAAAVSDAWTALPVRDGAASVVLSVFAPRDAAEIARVLAPAGALVVASPAPEHLQPLVERLGLLSVDARKAERQEASLRPHLVPAASGRATAPRATAPRAVRATLRLDRDAVRDLVGMGPSAWHVDPVDLERRLAALPDPVEVALAVDVTTYRRPGAPARQPLSAPSVPPRTK